MFRRIAPALLILTAIVLIAADQHPSNLTVHEWGTFTSIAGEDGSAMFWNSLACRADLPGFVNKYGEKWNIPGNMRMETPVLYFYAAREMQASVFVKFPHGVITEWYPQGDAALKQGTGSIQWRNIQIQPGTTPELPTDSRQSHYYAASETDSAPISTGDQHEKFMFY